MTVLVRWFGSHFSPDSIPARLRRDPLAVISVLIIFILFLSAIFAPLLTSRAADTLHRLLLNWPPRAELKVLVIENGILAIIGLSAGALFSLVTTFLR